MTLERLSPAAHLAVTRAVATAEASTGVAALRALADELLATGELSEPNAAALRLALRARGFDRVSDRPREDVLEIVRLAAARKPEGRITPDDLMVAALHAQQPPGHVARFGRD